MESKRQSLFVLVISQSVAGAVTGRGAIVMCNVRYMEFEHLYCYQQIRYNSAYLLLFLHNVPILILKLN